MGAGCCYIVLMPIQRGIVILEKDRVDGDGAVSSVPILVSVRDLWYLHTKVRHEIQGAQEWRYAPAGLNLNRKIQDRILWCIDNDEDSTYLDLDLGECLALDFLIAQDDKDEEGRPLGVRLLVEVFRARRKIEGGEDASLYIEHNPKRQYDSIPDAVEAAVQLIKERESNASTNEGPSKDTNSNS